MCLFVVAQGQGVGGALSHLLELVEELQSSHRPQTTLDEADIYKLTHSAAKLKQKLGDLKDIASESQTATAIIPDTEDLEALAEKELMAAAKVIEKAANDLMVATQSRTLPKPLTNELAPPGTIFTFLSGYEILNGMEDVAGAILDAAIAITKATGMLVNAAAVAQKERTVNSGSGHAYKKDPTWSRGVRCFLSSYQLT